jgi:hypothetical protein
VEDQTGLNVPTPVADGLHAEDREDDADEADHRSDPSSRDRASVSFVALAAGEHREDGLRTAPAG